MTYSIDTVTVTAYAYVLKSWNAFVADAQLRALRFRPHQQHAKSGGEILPRIAGS